MFFGRDEELLDAVFEYKYVTVNSKLGLQEYRKVSKISEQNKKIASLEQELVKLKAIVAEVCDYVYSQEESE